MPSYTFYPDPDPETTSVDGYCGRLTPTESFDSKRNGAGNDSTPSATNILAYLSVPGAGCPNFNNMQRGIMLWDTSSIVDTETITAATISLFGIDKLNGEGSTSLEIVQSAPASNTNIVNADYTTLSFTSFASMTYANFNAASAYNDFTLDANGRANISKTGISKFGAILGWDLNNSFGGSCVNDNTTYFSFSAAETVGTGQDPKLVVTTTAASAAKNLMMLFAGS